MSNAVFSMELSGDWSAVVVDLTFGLVIITGVIDLLLFNPFLVVVCVTGLAAFFNELVVLSQQAFKSFTTAPKLSYVLLFEAFNSSFDQSPTVLYPLYLFLGPQ